MARTVGSVGDATAAAVRAAALKRFAEKGFSAVSMRAIASDVGVQVGALYNHFPTKQALLHELLAGHMHDLLARAEASLPEQGAPTERLAAFTRFHVRHHLTRADAVFISYMELRSLDPENFREIDALRRRYEQRLIAILRDGVAAGAFQVDDLQVAAMAIIAMLTGVTTWFREGGRLTADEIEAIYVAMVVRSVAAGAGAA